jgi:23S rRNA (uracil1939-C5)-methyltransferase
MAAKIFEVDLTSYAYGGETIGRLPDGRAVFVPFAIPGEKVSIELVEEKRGFARARLLEVLEVSPLRISPRCAHFGECGGCHYQHISYETQLEAKATILRDQLERIGNLKTPPIQSITASPYEFYYRNQLQFHLTSQGALGYHKAGSETVFAASECHLPEAPINEVWPRLEFEAGTSVERVGLRLGSSDDLMILLESDSFEPPEISVEDLPVSVIHLSPAGPLVLAGSTSVEIEILERRYQVSAGSFFQINNATAALMVKCVTKLLEKRGALDNRNTALEVYCGVGLFSAVIAGKVGRLAAVESSSSAVEDFTVNLDEFDNVEIYEGPAEMILPEMDIKPDFMLVNPPRQGLDRLVIDAILQKAPKQLVYVSCDPATLGRDAKRLSKGGYRLEEIHLFDQFPQTYHIESISLWERPLAD